MKIAVSPLLLLTSALLMICRICAAENLPSKSQFPSAREPTLREKFEQQFVVGVAMDGNLPASYNVAELTLLRTQFAAITPANCMKMTHLQPKEGNFEFSTADSLVTFAS